MRQPEMVGCTIHGKDGHYMQIHAHNPDQEAQNFIIAQNQHRTRNKNYDEEEGNQ